MTQQLEFHISKLFTKHKKMQEEEEARKGLIKANVVNELALVLRRHIAKAAGPGPHKEHVSWR